MLRQGQDVTPAAFYLGLCRLHGILSPPAPHDFTAGGPFFFAATMVLHRFSISGPDLAIAAAKRSKQGQSVHRFLISSLDLRIDAAKRSKQGQTVHRFSISSPDLRIDAAKRSKQWQSLQPKGWSIVPRPKSLPAGRLGLGNTALPGNAAVGVVGVLLVEL